MFDVFQRYFAESDIASNFGVYSLTYTYISYVSKIFSDMKEIEDVVIVGGGPAGAYCAYKLAKNGISPVIFDDSHPREKPCGGGLSPLVLEKYPFIKNVPSSGIFSARFKIISPSGKEAIAEGKRGSFNISRLQLDKYILDMAIKNGARLVEERVIEVKAEKRLWILKTKKRRLKARIIIGADGANSLVRNEILDPIPKKNLGICFGYYASGMEKEDSIIKYLKENALYIWIFPREDHSSIGIGSELEHSEHLKEILDNFISTYCPHVKIISEFGAVIPVITDPNFYKLPCAGENWILIGDAAGHVDPVTGEGILYAMWGGELAADSIKNGNPKEFDILWRKEYGYDLLEGCKMRDTFYNSFMIELSVILASRSKTFSQLLYDITTSEEEYKTFNWRMIREFPIYLIEFIFNKK